LATKKLLQKKFVQKARKKPDGTPGKSNAEKTGGNKPERSRWYYLSLLLILILLPAWTFWPVLNHEFLNWDDPLNVLENPQIKKISFENLKGILFSSWKISGYYIPLTFFSFAADHALFGLKAEAFHRTSLILHILNVLLLFWFFYLLSRNVPIAFWGAAFFSIHPLHVEAISWVTERKGLLATFFLLGTLVSYLRHRETPSKFLYGGSIFFFFLSLLSKPTGLIWIISKADRGAGRLSTKKFLLSSGASSSGFNPCGVRKAAAQWVRSRSWPRKISLLPVMASFFTWPNSSAP
jgi:hypothetical protein